MIIKERYKANSILFEVIFRRKLGSAFWYWLGSPTEAFYADAVAADMQYLCFWYLTDGASVECQLSWTKMAAEGLLRCVSDPWMWVGGFCRRPERHRVVGSLRGAGGRLYIMRQFSSPSRISPSWKEHVYISILNICMFIISRKSYYN